MIPIGRPDSVMVRTPVDLLRQGESKKVSRMKKLFPLLAVTCVATGLVPAAVTAIHASDSQTLGPIRNSVGNGPTLLAQNNTAPEEPKGRESAKLNVDSSGVILKGCDAVAYFEQGKPVKGNPAIKSTYEGATYLFASEADKAAFDKDPARYAPQYGGFCAYGVVKGALDDFEYLGVFTIYKGRLYLCGNQDALDIFKNNIESNIEKADTNWRRLTGA
jgi:YHS domain-containing protein